VHLSLPSQTPSLAWPQVPEVNLPESMLLAVPVTILYDRGRTLITNGLLHRRIPSPYIELHPEDAQRLGFNDGAQIQFTMGDILVKAILHVSEQVPSGVGLVPRSLGIPINSPTIIELKVV